MNKSFFLLIGALTGALGCFGSDPNMNSQTFLGAGGSGTGTGGSGTGTGGSSGSVTGPIKGSPFALFNTSTEGFQLNVYHDTGNTNLGDPASGASPTLMFDSSTGNPDPGSLKVVAPYTGANQYVDIQKSMTNSPQDWRGKTLHVRIRVADGMYPGGAQVYVITVPNMYVFGGTFTNVAKNSVPSAASCARRPSVIGNVAWRRPGVLARARMQPRHAPAARPPRFRRWRAERDAGSRFARRATTVRCARRSEREKEKQRDEANHASITATIVRETSHARAAAAGVARIFYGATLRLDLR